MRVLVIMVALLGATATRATPLDVQSLRRSPRETTEATIAGATLSVTYGRPYARGRQIMGGLVPYGRIWRLGADEATTLETTHNLEFGNTLIPAGKYSLFAIPQPEEWTLIVNTQVGQWGTVYSDAQDMARIPMLREETGAPVEQFTISFQTSDTSSSALVFEWETTRLIVPFEVK